MKKICPAVLAIIVIQVYCGKAYSQTAWYYQWGILPENTIDYLIGESSGERAYNHIAELSEYNRTRTSSEFQGTLMESQYVVDKLNEYGLSEVKIERFDKVSSWRGIEGTLWETSPRHEKIADIRDMPFLLAEGSGNSDIEADLVYIGDAYNGELDNMDLTGKIVLTSARTSSVLNMVLQKGVVGIVSYYSPRPYENPIMIPQGDLHFSSYQPQVFAFNLPPRDGIIIRDRLVRGEKIRVHAIVKAKTEEIDVQVPGCIIPGTDPTTGEIIISAHLFEGYGVQGANDNISGSAAILETARVLRKLISDGVLSQPKRTIRFIWVPEYTGTIPWVNAHSDIIKRALCNINLDMVGLSLSKYKSSFILHRTSYGNASFLNDILENYYRYVGETNQINSVITGTRFFKRITALTGTDDPFYYQIESNSGGSDHDVFNDWGVQVPGILMITWPDPFYHTSQDRVDKCDPTQLKRAVFITAASAYTIALAGEDDAIGMAGEIYGNSVRRMGYQVSKSFDEIKRSGADELMAVLKRTAGNIKGVEIGEEMTLKSLMKLAPGSTRLNDLLDLEAKSLKEMSVAQIGNLIKTAEYRASDFGIAKLTLTDLPIEKKCNEIIPVQILDPRDLGYEGYNDRIDKLDRDIKNKYQAIGIADRSEAVRLINGKNTILEIKYILDAQNSRETSIEGLQNYFYLLKEAGLVRF